MADDHVDPPVEEVDDLGEPIEALRNYTVEPSSSFLVRLRNRLRRRDLSSQVATLSWTGLGTVVLEFFRMIFSIVDPDERGEGETD
ncbi:MAG: hypothetical protein AAF389_20025 [Gemmatimonadota bacterium]